jgi:integron integrase
MTENIRMTDLQSELQLKPRLLDQLRDSIRRKHYSLRTEKVYIHWVRRFILFHNKRHPKNMGSVEVTAFLNSLARQHVSASTQNQALAAILFLYKEILENALPWLDDLERAKQPARLPTVLSRDEVTHVLAHLDGVRWLMVSLMYGAGIRLMECLALRVKDVVFERNQILIRNGKGARDRVTILPESLQAAIKVQLERVKAMHEVGLKSGFGRVQLPLALDRKYPNAGFEWGWQFVFPSSTTCTSPYTGHTVRHHVHPKTVQRAVTQAARKAQIARPVSCHTFRHCFATHLLESGTDIRTLQELMGHKDVKTTMIYTHVMKKPGLGIKSPLDQGQ